MLDRLFVLLKKQALKISSLTRLERRGWIEALQSEDRRRPYRITGAGEVAFFFFFFLKKKKKKKKKKIIPQREGASQIVFC